MDIVDRARDYVANVDSSANKMILEMCETISRLTAERDGLRKALEDLLEANYQLAGTMNRDQRNRAHAAVEVAEREAHAAIVTLSTYAPSDAQQGGTRD